MNNLVEIWDSLGPAGPCAVLFLLGCMLILGFIFNWKWLYPSQYTVRNYKPGIRRGLLLVGGVILIVCSIVFYIYRDSMHWQ